MSEEDQHGVEQDSDSAEFSITTTGGHKVSCLASRGNGDIVMLSVTINGILHSYGDTRSDGSSLYSEARQEAEIVARLLDNGKIRPK